MNKKILAGVVVSACIFIIISIAYACVYLDIDADWRIFMGVGDTAEVYAWVNAGGPATDWDWAWPSEFYDVSQSDSGYDSTLEFTCDTAGLYETRVDGDSQYGWDRAYTDVYVVEVGLDQVDGAFVALYEDEEDELIQVVISLEPSQLNTGKVKLYASGGITVCSDEQGNNQISLPATWYVSTGQVPSCVWVKGTSVSSELNDASLEITYETYWSPVLDEDTVEFTVLDVEITEPDGPPDFDHQFSFNSASPGVCSIPETGYLTGTTNTDISTLDDGLKWTLSDHPSEPTGPQVTFTYTGLPSSNSGFGEKTLTLEYSNTGIKDTKTIEIFFEPTATNHPGAGSGTTPNWFYYWQNAGVISTDFEYDSNQLWGNYINGQLYLGPNAIGPDWDPTANGWPDNTVVFKNRYYHTTINSGDDGIARTWARSDDYQEVPYGNEVTPFSTIITWDDSDPQTDENDWMDSADNMEGDSYLPGTQYYDDELDLTDALTETNTYGKTGIDLVAVVCAHESQHKENDSLQGYDGDSDGIPDSDENSSGYNLNPYRKDTYDTATVFNHNPYFNMGDDEFLCCMVEAGVDEVDSNIDWSKDGKQWHQP